MAVESPAQDRGVLLVALLALAAVTAAGFGRVFEGGEATLRLVAAAVAATLLSGLLRRRHTVVSVVAAAAGLAMALGILVFPQTTVAGIPTGATLEAVNAALGHLGEQIATEVAPAPALPPLLMTAVVAVWAAAVAAHALAVRSRSPVLAILPSAALVAFASVVVEDAGPAGATPLLVLAAAGVLFGAGMSGLQLWAPVVSGRGRHVAVGPVGRWAAAIAAAAALVSIALPGLVPGYRGGPLLTFGPIDGASVGVNPIVDIRPSLLQNPPAHLFSVRAERAAYWRMLALDRFDGRVWTATDLAGEDGTVVRGEADLGASVPTTLAPGDPETMYEVVQDIEIEQLSTPWLPAAFQPAYVRLPGGDAGEVARYDPEAGMLVRPDRTEEGYRYRVSSLVAVPSREQLQAASDRFFPQTLPARYTQLPEDLPPRLLTIVREITAGKETPFDQMLAIQRHLRTFRYDERAPQGHGANHIVNFLTETRQGYCEQFAGTMAVLVRLLGYPSRVAVGFLPGGATEEGVYRVTTGDAHAWPEVLFPGVGWVAFEPTPTRANPLAQPYLAPPARGTPGDQRTEARERSDRASLERARQGAQGGAVSDRPSPGAAAGSGRDRWPWPVVVLVLAVAGLVAVAGAKLLVRRLAVSRATTPRARALAAYRVFLAEAADVGLARHPGETPWEYRARLRAEVRFSDGHLERLTGLAAAAVYGHGDGTRTDGRDAAAAVKALSRDLRRHAGPVRMAGALVRPSRPL
ncbi:MAG TPA: DUF3488 and transglutaminase-like domain-containing protein [Actinomycetota bacterium]|nr:DUF3488 and transglutaminase-like domain-containing protein [Actinomycetota bacterium]